MRDPDGKFQKGNKIAALKTNVYTPKTAKQHAEDISHMIREGVRMVREFDRYGSMNLQELENLMAAVNKNEITGKQAALIKFWSLLISTGDIQRFKMALNLYRIPTDIKAIEVNPTQPDPSTYPVEDHKSMELTKEEKLSMLDKMKVIVTNLE